MKMYSTGILEWMMIQEFNKHENKKRIGMVNKMR